MTEVLFARLDETTSSLAVEIAARIAGDLANQPLDPTLTAIAGVTTAANKLIYFTGVDVAAATDLSVFARTFIDDTSAGAVLTTLGLSANVQTFLGTPSSANLLALVTDETGTGLLVFGTNPVLTTPNLGTPSAVNLANGTNLPIGGIASLGTGIGTFLATPSSANLRAALTDESGTGALIFAGGALGAATATSINGIALTAGSGTLTLGTSTLTISGSTAITTAASGIGVWVGGNLTGSTSPALGTATATSINGATVSPGHYSGQPTNGSPAAGEIGEIIISTVTQASHVALVTGTPKDVTSISLTAGDWDVSGVVGFDGGSTTTVPFAYGYITTASVTLSTAIGTFGMWQTGFLSATPFNFGTVPGNELVIAAPVQRISLSGTTTIFLGAYMSFGVSTANAFGFIRARRAS